MKKPDCIMCDDTGFKDHAGSRLDPCDHLQLPPLPDLLPCPNPVCGSTNVAFRANMRGAQWISCADCSLSISDGGQDRQYAAWNGLLRANHVDIDAEQPR